MPCLCIACIMDYTSITTVNKKIQAFEYNYTDTKLYYPVADYLKELKDLMNVDHIDAIKFKELHDYVKLVCLNVMDNLIKDCKREPDLRLDRSWQIDSTVKTIKANSTSAIRCFKVAIEWYRPPEKSNI